MILEPAQATVGARTVMIARNEKPEGIRISQTFIAD